MDFGLMSLVTKQPLWLVCGRPMLYSTLINSLYRPRCPDEYMYIIMYTMRTNKFVLHTLYCRTTRTPFIDAFYSECIFEHDFDLISGINALNKPLILVDSFL